MGSQPAGYAHAHAGQGSCVNMGCCACTHVCVRAKGALSLLFGRSKAQLLVGGRTVQCSSCKWRGFALAPHTCCLLHELGGRMYCLPLAVACSKQPKAPARPSVTRGTVPTRAECRRPLAPRRHTRRCSCRSGKAPTEAATQMQMQAAMQTWVWVGACHPPQATCSLPCRAWRRRRHQAGRLQGARS